MTRYVFLLIAVIVLFASSILAQTTSSTAPATSTASTTKTSSRGPVFRPTKDQIIQVQKILKDKKLYSGEAAGS
jgi:hypothetical protein